MSDDRGDCEHGHAQDVMDLGERIAREHTLPGVTSAVLVLLHPDGTPPTVIGRFNTMALANAGDAVLLECGKHTPDGCGMCDPAAKAATLASDVLRSEFRRQQRAHAHNKGEPL